MKMQHNTVGSNRQTSVAPPGFPGGDTGVPFQRPPRFMDRGAQTWGSTAVMSQGAYAPTAAYVPRGPADVEEAYGTYAPAAAADVRRGPAGIDEPYGVDRPLTGFRSRIPRTSA